jgi:hypothetical protein
MPSLPSYPVVLLLACSVWSGPVRAESAPDNLQPLPDIAPPPGRVDADLEPHVTIVQRGEERIEEYRVKGRLYMIKVTPPHGRPYYLIDQRGDGQMRRYDDLSPNFQVPLWVIYAF